MITAWTEQQNEQIKNKNKNMDFMLNEMQQTKQEQEQEQFIFWKICTNMRHARQKSVKEVHVISECCDQWPNTKRSKNSK